jgi:hypothetical protein
MPDWRKTNSTRAGAPRMPRSDSETGYPTVGHGDVESSPVRVDGVCVKRTCRSSDADALAAESEDVRR